jgi:hypothetical protein
MTIHFRQFLIRNILVGFLLAIIAGVFYTIFFAKFYHPFLPAILILATGINIILYYVITRKKVSDSQLVNWVLKSFAIKFFSYLAMALLFFLIVSNKPQRISFVISLFIVYFSFTSLEIVTLLKFLKSEDNK